MMTTVTTVLGLLPLALGIGEGSEFLQPLGIVVFFGMSIATVLALFIIPCFYVMFHEFPGGKKPLRKRRRIIVEKEPLETVYRSSAQ
jgi:Cu/Ag efflux pump CusA